MNYQDGNLNISIPVFSIHGNHDDPTGVIIVFLKFVEILEIFCSISLRKTFFHFFPATFSQIDSEIQTDFLTFI